MYFLFKFIHIAAAIVWIGGIFTLSTLNLMLVRKENLSGLVMLGRQSEFFGRAVIGPSAAITLIAGIVMVAVYNLGMSFWIIWGLAVMFISMGLGGSVIRKTGQKLEELASSVDPDDSRLQKTQRRMSILSIINLLLLLSAVWVMVFKPTL